MKKVLFVSNTEEDGSLARGSLEALTAARTLSEGLGAELAVGLFGASVDRALPNISAVSPTVACAVTGPEFGPSRYASDRLAIEALVSRADPQWVVAPQTARMSRVLPGVALRTQGRIDTHVTGFSVEGASLSVKRWYYRQRMEAEQRRSARPWFLAIDPGNFEVLAPSASNVSVETIPVSVTESLLKTRVEGFSQPGTDEQTIRPEAEVLFVAGAGWTKKQADGQVRSDSAAGLILTFLKKSGASLGGTKSIVDLSGEGQAVLPFMTHLNQVGQTGATPRHPKGLATCCHGEEPHVIGWRFIKERRAINLNPSCGWAQGKADVLYVADAFEVLSKLNELLG